MPRLAFASAVFLITATSAQAASNPERQHNEAGIRAVEAHWTKAFLSGDEAYLGTLLDEDYVSVGRTGMPRPKAEIIALAKKIAAGPPPGPFPPSTLKVVIRGDAAIVTTSAAGDASVDLFRWQGGRWHAWYSQHTPVAPPKA